MSVNPFTEIDYLADARTRYTEQFKNKVVFDKYVQLFLNEFTELQTVYKDLMQLRSLDTATGAQLDIIGEIVGQPREVVDVTIYNFGFEGAAGALSFGDPSNPLVGGFWRRSTDPISGARYLNDIEYRTLIKVKIIKNTSNGCINDVLLAAQILLNEYNIIIEADSNAEIRIDLQRAWDDVNYTLFLGINEKSLARKYLPIPNGVLLNFGDDPAESGFTNGFNNGFG
jgi:hypothetical protein